MDNNKFVIKNSTLITLSCFFLINLSNIIFFDFVYDNNIAFAGFFYFITITALIAIYIISLGIKVEGVTTEMKPTESINKVFEYIHGKDNFIEPFPKLGFNIPVIGKDFSMFIYFFVIILFIIMGSVNGGYATRKKKHNLKFSPTRNIVLGILMFSVMFLFFQLIFTSIVNNVTKTQLNTNFNLYMFLFLFLLLLYSGFYCYYVDQQKNEKDNNNNNQV